MSNCIEIVRHSRVKVEENRRKAIFRNESNLDYRRGKIDGCLITEGIRADYFVSGDGKTVLIELKGCDVAHASKQLLEAAEHGNVKPHLVGKLGFLIICSRFPSHDTTIQLAKERAKKKYGAKFLVINRAGEVDMSMF